MLFHYSNTTKVQSFCYCFRRRFDLRYEVFITTNLRFPSHVSLSQTWLPSSTELSSVCVPWTRLHFVTPPPILSAEYCDEHVCLSVCQCLSVHDHISGTVYPIFTNFLMPVTYGGGSVLLWRRSDMLCTAGFVDNVISAHKLTGCSTSPPGWGSEAHKQPWAWRVGIPVAGSGRSGLLLAVTAY